MKLVDCEACDGLGEVVDGHPNDPYALNVECEDCDGAGTVEATDDDV